MSAAIPGGRMLRLAVLGEGALALAGWAWAFFRELPLAAGPVAASVAAGVAAAAGLAAVQYGLLRLAPPWAGVSALRRLYRDVLRPLFSDLRPIDVVVISVMAGVGEELLFRGAMQQDWGWAIASVLFGVCHMGGRATIPLAAWAAVTGGLLGWLMVATGGLLAPIVAHAVYDAVALVYIRWGPPLDEEPAGAPAPAP